VYCEQRGYVAGDKKERERARGGPKKGVANIVRRPRQRLPRGDCYFLHIFGGKMSEKSVAVVVRSPGP